MNPSDEKKAKQTSPSATKPRILPWIVFFVLATAISWIFFYFNPSSETPAPDLTEPVKIVTEPQTPPENNLVIPGAPSTTSEKVPPPDSSATESAEALAQTQPGPDITSSSSAIKEKTTACNKSTQQLNDFYKHLDQQPYMADYELKTPSQQHFTALVKKLLANPPQVARESDDLYTILKNTAHFFRVSGKDNIFMMKGILDKEKGDLEQILADYYLLVTTSDCSQTPYAHGIDSEALYEYACFFLNTMGGRLYLFRRDSQSRMVVTYYAILLINQANNQQNNRHGIALKPAINMLIAEMEAGGSALKKSDSYLDTLYDLKEIYQ